MAGIRYIDLNITKPELFQQVSIEFNKISIFTGPNGTGKTYLFITCYALTEISRIALESKIPVKDLISSAQFILDSCFTDYDMTGSIGIVFDSGMKTVVTCEDGKVKDISIEDEATTVEINSVRYMSSAYRTFHAIKGYLIARKLFMPGKSYRDPLDEKALMSLVKDFRLFDISHIERLIASTPWNLEPSDIDRLEQFVKNADIKTIDFDEDRGDFVAIYSDGKRKYLTHLSAGEQSVINMIMGSKP